MGKHLISPAGYGKGLGLWRARCPSNKLPPGSRRLDRRRDI
jgi:hypothetical protein